MFDFSFRLSYFIPSKGSVRHLASPEYHPKYSYPTFLGGILLLRVEDFLAVNGMSNRYWGWGMEDDEFRVSFDCSLLVSKNACMQCTIDT